MTKEQKDVLAKKDGVTQGPRGLQVWTDESTPDDATKPGEASQGTVARAARMGEQDEREDA